MWANRFNNFVFALKNIIFMILPVFLKIRTSLLIDLLLDIKVSLVEDSDIISKNGNFNLRSIEPIKWTLPPLNKDSRDHDVISWLTHINQIIFHDYNN